VGGGLFGCYAAIALADRGHNVLLMEQDSDLMKRASFVNQARLHTGLHYPRSLLTAQEALHHYQTFRARWPEAVRDFQQVYAVAARNSKTTGADFAAFIQRLGLQVDEISPRTWFKPGSVSHAFSVEEPAFDARTLRQLMKHEIAARSNISVMLSTALIEGQFHGDRAILKTDSHDTIETEGVVLAAYAGTNALRQALGLEPLPLSFELTEVLLGNVTPELKNVGFTVMDGPFWSLMPFGHGDQVTLTSVGLTPLQRSSTEADFPCQAHRPGCTPLHLKDCTSCPARPPSASTHQQQQMSAFLRNASAFTPTGRLLTIKTILRTTEVDDARPTLVHKEVDSNVTTIFSGKINTIFDLDRDVQ